MVSDKSIQETIDRPDADLSAPPEPEQIWPPPEPTMLLKAPRVADLDDLTFSGDPDLAWEDETEKISRAIDEIRHLDDTGEADQVETGTDFDEDEDDVVAIPSPQAEVRGIIAGTAPVLLKQTKAPAPQTRLIEPPRRTMGGARRVNEAAERELAQLWSNLFFSGDRPAPRAVVVTAARSGDGTTQIASSLAMIGAETNPELRIALVDLNLRNPEIARLLGARSEPGIADILDGTVSVEQATQSIAVPGGRSLYVITAGKAPAHPLSLIKSRPMSALVARIAAQFDHTIFDVSSSDAFPDAQVIGSIVDGALLVVSGGSTPRETVAAAKKRLDLAHVKCLGLVLNQRSDPIPEALYRIA